MLNDLHEEFFSYGDVSAAARQERWNAMKDFHFIATTIRALLAEKWKTPTLQEREKFRHLVHTVSDHFSFLQGCRELALHKHANDYHVDIALYQNMKSDEAERFVDFLRIHYQRLRLIRPDSPIFKVPDLPEAERICMAFRETIRFGIMNIVHHSFSYLDIIANVLRGQTGRVPHPEESGAVTPSVLRRMLDVASADDDLFSVLNEEMRRHEHTPKDEGFVTTPFHAEDFELRGEELELRPTVFERSRARLKKLFDNRGPEEEPRVGCPSTPIFPIVNQWCCILANEEMFPVQERLMRLPDCSGCEQ